MIRRSIGVLLLITLCLTVTAPAFAAEQIGYVTSTGLYIREKPDAAAKVYRCAAKGESLTIIKDVGNWYYVRYNAAVTGYVAKAYVTLTAPKPTTTTGTSSSSGSSSTLTTIAALGTAPKTTRAGDKGDDVRKLQQALIITGYLKGNADGVYGTGTVAAVKAFQKAHGMSQDGVAGPVTIKNLFDANAASGGSAGSSGPKTEKISWTNGGSTLIPRGTYFNIKDVRTGTIIRVRHLYGAAHLDVEPANADETAKLKKVYGGDWSWDRRPILVQYDGRIIAASMNGMPHGDQVIENNNFNGQFCIHLANSKTHGSDNVDPDHQAAVNTAANAAW